MPVLVRLSLANFEYFGDTKPDGSDLRFVAADDKTPLEFHIERYDAAAQMAFVWVRVPRLTGGGEHRQDLSLLRQQGTPRGRRRSGGTYDTNQALVYHFGAAAGLAAGRDGLQAASRRIFQAEVNPASLIGAGARFNGTQLDHDSRRGRAALQPDAGHDDFRLGAARHAADPGLRRFARERGARAHARHRRCNRSWRSRAPARRCATRQRRCADARASGITSRCASATASSRCCVDGAAGRRTPTVGERAAIAGTLTVGASQRNANFLTGELDELQVSNVARSADWLRAAARSQGMVAPLLVYGGDAQKEAAAAGWLFRHHAAQRHRRRLGRHRPVHAAAVHVAWPS